VEDMLDVVFCQWIHEGCGGRGGIRHLGPKQMGSNTPRGHRTGHPESRGSTSSTAGQGTPFTDLFGLVRMASENARAICRASRTPQSLPSATPRTLDTSRRNLPAEGKGCRWAMGHLAMTSRASTQERGHVVIPSRRIADLQQRSNARNQVSNTWPHPASSEAGMKGDNNFLSEPLIQ